MMDRVLSWFLGTTDLPGLGWKLGWRVTRTSPLRWAAVALHHAVSLCLPQRQPATSQHCRLLKQGDWCATVRVWFQGGPSTPRKHQEPRSVHLWLQGNGFAFSWGGGCSGREKRGCQAWWTTFCRCLPTNLGWLDTEAELCVLSPLPITKCEELSFRRRN